VIALPFGQDHLLMGKLEQLDTLILVDALLLSPTERYVIDQWVRAGGTLIAIGRCGIMDENLQTQPGLSALSKVIYTPAAARQKIIFAADAPVLPDYAVAVAGSTENLYVQAVKSNFDYAQAHQLNYDYAEKWPLYYRTAALEKMRKSKEPVDDMLGKPAGIGFEIPDAVKAWAKYEDGQPALIETTVDRGRVIHVAPVDLFANDLNPDNRRVAGALLDYLTPPIITLEPKHPSLELTLLKKQVGLNSCYVIHLLNHGEDDQHIIGSEEPMSHINVRLRIPKTQTLQSVQAFSPDAGKVEFTTTFDAQESLLLIALPKLEIYTVFAVNCQ